MARPAHPLRAALEADLLAHIQTRGDDFDKASLVAQYVDRGVGQATVYAWIANVVRRGKPSKPAKPKNSAPPSAAVAHEAGAEIVPAARRVPVVGDVSTIGLIPVISLLHTCIEQAQALIKHATNPDGSVRNARLLTSASENLRRAIETSAKLNETVILQQETEKFLGVVIDEIAREIPAVQERILGRLSRACDTALANS